MTNPYAIAFPPVPRSRLPGGITHFYTNYGGAQPGWAAGDDDNDGLSPLTPKKTAAAMAWALLTHFDWSAYPQSRARINLAPNVTDEKRLHLSAHSIPGAQGGAAFQLYGGEGSRIFSSEGSAIESYNGFIVQTYNVKLESSAGSCIVAGHGGEVYIGEGTELGQAKSIYGSQVLLGYHGRVFFQGNIKVSGTGMAACISNGSLGIIDGSGKLIMQNDAHYSTGFLLADGPSKATFNLDIDTNGKTITGPRYNVGAQAKVLTKTQSASTFFPGDVNGSCDPLGFIL